MFGDGIVFSQRDMQTAGEEGVQANVNRSGDSARSAYLFTPFGSANISSLPSTVQIEFFVDSKWACSRWTIAWQICALTCPYF